METLQPLFVCFERPELSTSIINRIAVSAPCVLSTPVVSLTRRDNQPWLLYNVLRRWRKAPIYKLFHSKLLKTQLVDC